MLRCGEQAGLPRCEREVLRCCEHAATRARGVPAGGGKGVYRTCIWTVRRALANGGWRVAAQRLVTCRLQGDTGIWRGAAQELVPCPPSAVS